jgi:aspartate carbamoyltransferase catalytic subunit
MRRRGDAERESEADAPLLAEAVASCFFPASTRLRVSASVFFRAIGLTLIPGLAVEVAEVFGFDEVVACIRDAP